MKFGNVVFQSYVKRLMKILKGNLEKNLILKNNIHILVRNQSTNDFVKL